MKQFTILCSFLLGSTLGFAQPNNYQVGDVVDNFTVTDTDGVEHTLYDITASGKHVFLDFFFTTCPPCQQTQQHFNHLHDKYGCNQGDLYTLSITGYPGDTDAKVIQFEQNYGGPYNHSPAISIEGNGAAVVQNFGISLFPNYLIIGPDNTLVNADIWPISSIDTFENAFPDDFNPNEQECTALGTIEINDQQFSLSPTVSNGQINVNLNQSTDAEILIYSSIGKEVFKNYYPSVQNIPLNLRLKPGIYFMKISTADQKSETKKFIIK